MVHSSHDESVPQPPQGESEARTDFLVSEFWILSWNASVQRAKLYRKNVPESYRKTFRKRVIAHLEDHIMWRYKNLVSESEHCEHIQTIAKQVPLLDHDKVLQESKYRIGVAQKLLNLQLKYLWCAGVIKHEPPHCPVDRIVISKTRLKNKENWTEIDSIKRYDRVMHEIKQEASVSGLTPSQWELTHFSRRQP